MSHPARHNVSRVWALCVIRTEVVDVPSGDGGDGGDDGDVGDDGDDGDAWG